jgi:PKD repeat protein
MARITRCGRPSRHSLRKYCLVNRAGVVRTPLFGVFLAAGALLLPVSANAAVLYVDADASGTNTGANWDDAYTELNSALTSAEPGSEIWVAEGSYKPGAARADTFQLRSNIALYGGFDGTETSREQRDHKVHATILNGDLLGDDYSRFVNGHAVWSNLGDNSHHIVTGSGSNASAILDGFVIAHGYARPNGFEGPDIQAGGGIIIRNGSPTISNTRIDGSSGYYGGGAYVDQGSAPSFTNCEFHENSTDIGYGGAMNITGSSSVTFSNCHFQGNAAIGTQSPEGYGGALYVNFGSTANITGSSFVGNITGYRTYTTGGATSTKGGAIMAGGDILVRDSSFIGNRSHYGGAIYAFNGVTLINNIFSGNRVTTAPGSAGGGYGGAMILTGPSTVINNTITANTATEGTGGVVASVAPGESVQIVNTILWGNTVSKYIAAGEDPLPVSRNQLARGGDVAVSYGILQGLYDPIPGEDLVDPENFPGVLDADPLFVSQAGGDLHLDAGSPAIDSGDNTVVSAATDIDGDPRFQDDPGTVDTGNGTAPVVDMGAYEFAGIASDNIPPVAAASANPASGEVPLDVQFSSAASGDPDGQIVAYSWDFGDGSSSSEIDPLFSYQSAGVYTAVLTVTDDLGVARTDSVVISVTEPAVNQAPVANVSSDWVAGGMAPLLVEFDGSLSTDDSLIISYAWDFGDGITGNGDTIKHTYDSGTYKVTLTVTDDEGATGTATVSITVDPDTSTPPADTAPTAPTNLTIALVKTGKGKNKVVTGATLNWTDTSDNETGFVVESCPEVTTGKRKNRVTTCDYSEGLTIDADANSTSQLVPTDSGYRYRVKATNNGVDSAYTNEVSI